MDEIHRRRGVPALQMAKGDVFPRAFAMGLKVEQQHRVARLREKFRAGDQRSAVTVDAMRIIDDRAHQPERRSNKPAVNRWRRSLLANSTFSACKPGGGAANGAIR